MKSDYSQFVIERLYFRKRSHPTDKETASRDKETASRDKETASRDKETASRQYPIKRGRLSPRLRGGVGGGWGAGLFSSKDSVHVIARNKAIFGLQCGDCFDKMRLAMT